MIPSKVPSPDQDYVMLFAYNQAGTAPQIPELSKPTPPDIGQLQEKIAQTRAQHETHSFYENTHALWETLELRLHEAFNREMYRYEAELAKYHEFLRGPIFVFNGRKIIQNTNTFELRDIGKASWLDSWRYTNLKPQQIECSDIFYTEYAQAKTRHYFCRP